MIRFLYRVLIRLHPAAFRREYSGGMLWIFEESVATEGATRLLADAIGSLARQWLVRSGAWKAALALLGASLHLAVGIGWSTTPSRAFRPEFPADPAVTQLAVIAAVTVAVVASATLALVFWSASVMRLRRGVR